MTLFEVILEISPTGMGSAISKHVWCTKRWRRGRGWGEGWGRGRVKVWGARVWQLAPWRCEAQRGLFRYCVSSREWTISEQGVPTASKLPLLTLLLITVYSGPVHWSCCKMKRSHIQKVSCKLHSVISNAPSPQFISQYSICSNFCGVNFVACEFQILAFTLWLQGLILASYTALSCKCLGG